MTPRERVEAVLLGRGPDRVPFTVYECMLPQCAVERQLRNDGLCIMNRQHSGYYSVTPNCPSETHTYADPHTGKTLSKTVTHTPKGDLVSVSEPAGFTSWRHELPFRGPGDYAKLIALADDTQFVPNYDTVARAQAWLGDDVFLRGGVGGYSPLQALIYSYIGVEQFAIEWAERRDDLMKLYDALTERNRRCYKVIADGPHWLLQYGGNVSPEIVGRERFEKYIVNHYNELGEMLHKRGKMLLVHLDANCALLSDLIASSEIDVIEAFTPAPDTDMSIAQARAAWPEKIIWANFPSSVHLSSDEVVYETACRMIEEDGGSRKLLIGITEDVPQHRWQGSFQAINRACVERGGYA
jgi:hypothetical protein